jgi:hypothetical protein
MQIKRRKTLGMLFSLMLIVGAAASFTAPRSQAVEAAQDNRSVTSTDRHIACKRGCEEKYSSCLAAKKAKGWDDDRAEKMCGLSARSCQGACDRR